MGSKESGDTFFINTTFAIDFFRQFPADPNPVKGAYSGMSNFYVEIVLRENNICVASECFNMIFFIWRTIIRPFVIITIVLVDCTWLSPIGT